MDNNNMKTYMIIYRDSGGYKCGIEMPGYESESEAIKHLVKILQEDNTFFTEIVDIEEIEENEE